MATIITTPQQLYNIRDDINGEYELGANIDLDGTIWAGGEGWLPIPNFSGKLDGKGFAIRNLFINRPEGEEQGLFGRITGTNGTEIKNLLLLNVNITGRAEVGGLVGEIDVRTGTAPLLIENVIVRGVITAGGSTTDYVGGFIGRITRTSNTERAIVQNCGFEGIVTGDRTRIGGFVGETMAVVFTRCYSWATVNAGRTGAPSSVAGFSGFSVTTPGIGQTAFSNCYCRGALSLQNLTSFGSVAGFYTSGTSPTISVSQCYSAISFGGNEFVRGFTNNTITTPHSGCLYDSELAGVSDTMGGSIPRTTEQMKTKSTFQAFGYVFD